MEWVTIKGSISPCLELARGEIREVQYDDHVQRLINGGFIEVVEWHDLDEPEAVDQADTGPESGESEGSDG